MKPIYLAGTKPICNFYFSVFCLFYWLTIFISPIPNLRRLFEAKNNLFIYFPLRIETKLKYAHDLNCSLPAGYRNFSN